MDISSFPFRKNISVCSDIFLWQGVIPSLKKEAPEHCCIRVCVKAELVLEVGCGWGVMPLDVVIAPAEDCFWPDLQDTDMRLKIRVRRMKQGRELRGVYPPGEQRRVCVFVQELELEHPPFCKQQIEEECVWCAC